ncbi:MAG TPA: sugar nucleotide-binding protein, partial [Acidimicrobiales bacterium]|nr:sugar nucleotide-binding protein [Acidimicrobiales bacterium]
MVPEQAMTAPLRVLLTGAKGQLGQDLQAVLAGRTPTGGAPGSAVARAAVQAVGGPDQVSVLAAAHDTMDVADGKVVDEAFDAFHPDVVVHAGAYNAVDACESDPDAAFAVNTTGTGHVAEASARSGAHLLYVSTDYVFDGDADHAYVEGDTPNPR